MKLNTYIYVYIKVYFKMQKLEELEFRAYSLIKFKTSLK